MTDEEMAAFKAAMEEQGEKLRAALAEDLGGDPEDYRFDPDDVPEFED